MTRLVLTSCLALALTSSISAAPTHWRTDQFSITLPSGWEIADSTGGFPYHLFDSSRTAEMFLFHSKILPKETIDDERTLEQAVGDVINGVLPEISELQMLRSTGYLDHDRALFVIDFLSTDSLSGVQLYHRMQGVLYRLKDDSQLLYTLWAKTEPGLFEQRRSEIESLLQSFEYTGPRQSSVFGASRADAWYLIVLLFGLTAAVLYFSRIRLKRTGRGFSESMTFWRCSCGRLNHQSRSGCRRCGQKQLVRQV